MSLLEAIILGILQGATEFLPVSSSGHLVLVPWWLDMDNPPLIFVVTVHVATTVAVLTYFWNDWFLLLQASFLALRKRSLNFQENPELRLLAFLLVGTLPAAVIGVLLADYFDAVFATPALVSFNLLVTAGLLSYSEYRTSHQKTDDVNVPDHSIPDVEHEHQIMKSMSWLDVWIIGFAQALAIMPGISRSGSTIAAGLFRGLERPVAARYSFLLSTPIIMGAGAKQFLDLLGGDIHVDEELTAALAGGFIAALLMGYLSIALLLRLVRKRGLYGFAIYCAVFGLVSLGAAWLQG